MNEVILVTKSGRHEVKLTRYAAGWYGQAEVDGCDVAIYFNPFTEPNTLE